METAAGGSHGGGAKVSDLGRQVLAYYRALQQIAAGCEQSAPWLALKAMLRERPMAHQQPPSTP